MCHITMWVPFYSTLPSLRNLALFSVMNRGLMVWFRTIYGIWWMASIQGFTLDFSRASFHVRSSFFGHPKRGVFSFFTNTGRTLMLCVFGISRVVNSTGGVALHSWMGALHSKSISISRPTIHCRFSLTIDAYEFTHRDLFKYILWMFTGFSLDLRVDLIQKERMGKGKGDPLAESITILSPIHLH